MTTQYLTYRLHDTGYVHHWLVGGPHTIPVEAPESTETPKKDIARQYYAEASGIEQTPREWDPPLIVEGVTHRWRWSHCREDHLLDLSTHCRSYRYLRAWAYAQVELAQAHDVTFSLATNGPADLWVDGEHVRRHEAFDDQPAVEQMQASLTAGRHEILVRFEQVALGHTPYTMSLRLGGVPSDEVSVLLPTVVQDVARRAEIEAIVESAYLDRELHHRDDQVIVRWPDDLEQTASAALRFMDARDRITCEGIAVVKASTTYDMIKAVERSDGRYYVRVMPFPKEYYDDNQRVVRRIDVQVLNNPHSEWIYGEPEARRLEALEYASRRGSGVYAEVAKVAMGRWNRVEASAIADALDGIRRRELGSELDLAGLLGAIAPYLDHPEFPETLRSPWEESVLGFAYAPYERGINASESHQILFHACQVLAGQLYPEGIFAVEGMTGREQQARGEQRALAWLQQRGMGGFREWDSSLSYAEELVALVCLAERAQNPQVRAMAAALANKIVFSLALHSHLGVYSPTQGRISAMVAKNPKLAPTAGVSRLLWGMGVYNQDLPATVMLAAAKAYDPPTLIKRIARHRPRGLWSRQHAGDAQGVQNTAAAGSWSVDTVTYRMPEYVLSSAQDWRPGQRGQQEHIWQATLGPEAIVFVTHPANCSENPSLTPNFWAGNAVLPRVAQWKSTLIAVHKLPENDTLGYTHAYWPIYAFDEQVIRDGWAFARKGDGYVALAASQGLTLVTRGDSAYRELRSYGQQNVWLCQMGRAARDGSFQEFQESVLQRETVFQGLSVRCGAPDGDIISFGWDAPLVVNGAAQAITGIKHYENRYCSAEWPASVMELHHGEESLKLEFGAL